jgi:hypothetical protein
MVHAETGTGIRVFLCNLIIVKENLVCSPVEEMDGITIAELN